MDQQPVFKPGKNSIPGGRRERRTLTFTPADISSLDQNSEQAQAADRIEFHAEGRVFVLKNRNGACGEVIVTK